MRYKKTAFLALIILLFILGGCGAQQSGDSIDVQSTIEKPKNNRPLLEGVWRIEQIQNISDVSTLPSFEKGDALYISNQLVGIRNFYTIRPTVSAKYVEVVRYLESRFQKVPSLLYSTDKNINVVMVREGDSFSMDILSLSATRCCFVYDSRIYYAIRESDAVDRATIAEYNELARTTLQGKTPEGLENEAAFLIGIREQVQDDYGSWYYTYRTYFVRERSEDSILHTYSIENLLVPRADSLFSMVEYEVKKTDEFYGAVEGEYREYPASQDAETAHNVLLDKNKRGILYVTDGTISFEKIENIYSDQIGRRYEIYPLDSLGGNPYTVDQIAGEDGKEAFTEMVLNQLHYLDPATNYDAGNADVEEAYIGIDYTNIGIDRQNTSWSFFTRLEVDRGDEVYSSKFPVDIISKIELIRGESLSIPWTQVSYKSTQAVSAFSASRANRVFIKNEDELQYYAIKQGRIADSPILSIQLSENSKVVLFESAYGDPARLWEEEILRHPLKQVQVLYGQ